MLRAPALSSDPLLPHLVHILQRTAHGYSPGAGYFLDSETRQQSKNSLQLIVGTCGLYGKLIETHIHNLAAENIHNAQNLAALAFLLR